eukprot:sb/3475980/
MLCLSIVAIVLVFVSGSAVEGPQTLYLPSPQNTSNYARADFSQLNLQSLTEYTVSIWVKPDIAPDEVCPFSYSTSEDPDETGLLPLTWYASCTDKGGPMGNTVLLKDGQPRPKPLAKPPVV